MSADLAAQIRCTFWLAGGALVWWDRFMKISQKLEYACRSMVQLAKRHDGRTITRLEELAQREAVSASFLVQILNDLRRGGLIESRRGKTGGYLLARAADSITLRQIVEAVDPELLVCTATTAGESGPSVRLAWERATASLRQTLDQLTLQSLADSGGGAMFYI